MTRLRESRTSNRQAHGFTLIELLVALAIVAILAGMAVSTYSRYTLKTNRAAAAAVMLGIANRQEQYYLDARQYAADIATLGVSIPDEASNNYTLATANNAGPPPTFTVTATPKGNQLATDTKCGTLTLTSAGVKSVSGSGGVSNCW